MWYNAVIWLAIDLTQIGKKLRRYSNKYRLSVLIVLSGVISLAQSDPAEYLKFIDAQNELIHRSTWNYMQEYSLDVNPNALKGARKQLENQLKASLSKISRSRTPDKEFTNQAMTYVQGNLDLVEGDLKSLLKDKNAGDITINQLQILQQLRKRIQQIRQNYDQAVIDYGQKYGLNLTENDSRLAQNMAATIRIYDYYNQLQLVFKGLQQEEYNFWQDMNNKSLVSYDQSIQELKAHLASVKVDSALLAYEGDGRMGIVLEEYHQFLTKQVQGGLDPIRVIKNATPGNLTAQTDAYNQSIHWANRTRKKLYERWKVESKEFLRRKISSLISL
ncbi:hypothetical protein [Nonlabens xiamenensis]|uniref:hypothetical protein n=1 Tax=Nonlabens xiamenensis TaxID=2341043 RepID=UPI000F60D88C|nr:hypothetical protein [Nonlabens xiamenensis]